MPRIYISYRRDDSAGYAGRLYDQLTTHFGAESVFLDVSSIQPGADFTEVIGDVVRSTDVALVMIGPAWSTSRLDDPHDFVRHEIAAALAADIRVIPVLVEGARMPPPSALPGDLAGLSRRQALVLEAATWRADVDRLMRALDATLEQAPEAPRRDRWHRRDRSEPAPEPNSPHDRSQAVSLVMAGVDFDAAVEDLPGVALALAGSDGRRREMLLARVEELRAAPMGARAKTLSLGFAIEEFVGLDVLGAAVESLGNSVRGVAAAPDVRAVDVFYSYSHRDEELRDELEKHLTILRRQSVIRDWHDRKIAAGTEWRGRIDERLERAQLILLLISSDFISSDYCYDVELTRAMERHRAGSARVVPVVLRPVYWKGAPFGELQALPTDAKAVTQYANRDEAFTIVAEGIAEAAAQLQAAV